jgi:hypothetical protein
MSEDKLDDAIVAGKEALEGLIEKGLIVMIGYDPLGRPVYTNTALGNAVADEIERQEKTMNLGPEEEELIPYDETEDDEDWTTDDGDFDSYDDEEDDLDDEDNINDDEDDELEDDDEDWDDDVDDSEEDL